MSKFWRRRSKTQNTNKKFQSSRIARKFAELSRKRKGEKEEGRKKRGGDEDGRCDDDEKIMAVSPLSTMFGKNFTTYEYCTKIIINNNTND